MDLSSVHMMYKNGPDRLTSSCVIFKSLIFGPFCDIKMASGPFWKTWYMVMGARRMVEIDGIYPGHHLLSGFRLIYLVATCLLTIDIGKNSLQTLFLLGL